MSNRDSGTVTDWDQLVNMEWLGLGLDHPKRFVEALRAVTVEQVQEAVRRNIRPDRLITVAVGRV